MNLQNVRLPAVDDTTVFFESRETFTTAILSEKQGNKNTKMNIEEEGEGGFMKKMMNGQDRNLHERKVSVVSKAYTRQISNVSSFCRWLLQAERHHACLNPVKPAERKTFANLVGFSSHTHRHFF